MSGRAGIDGLLGDFIVAHAARPWNFGSVDCLLTLADWVVYLGYMDPVPGLRGSYSTKAECIELMTRNGGAIGLTASACALLCIREIGTPGRGDIGIIGSALALDRQWGAIYDGGAWLVRGERGFASVRGRWRKAWRP